MPIYEYKCGECRRRVSLFFPNFAVAESRAAAGENRCPRCGSPDLARLMSRANTIRPGASDNPDADFTDAMSSDALMSGLDEEDPRAVARWARQMKDSIGEELDMGPEFDQALARIEAGEDPERVMDDMDPEALALGGGDGAADDMDFGD